MYNENFIEEEEYEEEYLDDPHQQRGSVDNNNYRMDGYDENAQQMNYELYPDDNNQNTYEDMNKVENRDIMHNRNDTNNNANGELYGYQQQQFDVDQMKNKTNLAINNNISEEEYYEEMYEDDVKMMKDNDHHNYEEEFDNEYAQNSITAAKQQQQQQHVQKQMSILSEDAHQNDEYMNDKRPSLMNDDQRALHDEYLDEFPEDEHVLQQQKMNNAASIMRKQESVMEDDPELKHLEEKQNQKNQQMQQQQHNEFYPEHVKDTLDPFDIGVEVKRKKSVTIINDAEMLLPEKSRELRSAKQRWHWAYNRIVHQARVSVVGSFFV